MISKREKIILADVAKNGSLDPMGGRLVRLGLVRTFPTFSNSPHTWESAELTARGLVELARIAKQLLAEV